MQVGETNIFLEQNHRMRATHSDAMKQRRQASKPNPHYAAFKSGTNKITIFDKTGKEYSFDSKPKKEVAKDIVNAIIQYKNA